MSLTCNGDDGVGVNASTDLCQVKGTRHVTLSTLAVFAVAIAAQTPRRRVRSIAKCLHTRVLVILYAKKTQLGYIVLKSHGLLSGRPQHRFRMFMLCFSASSTRNVFIKIKYKKISRHPPSLIFYQTATGSTGISLTP